MRTTPVWLLFTFSALAVAVAGLAAWGVAVALVPAGRAARARLPLTAAPAAVWLALWWAVARSGVLMHFDCRPPPLLFALVATLLAGLGIGLSPLGGRIARRLPLAALVGFQAFRLPLELIMDGAARAGVMPVQMSFEGRNYDIVTGASALVLGLLLRAGRAPLALVAVWNLTGIVLLGNIVGVAVASLPPWHAFGTEPENLNTWIAAAPFIWLPTVFVACAIAGHILVARRLLLERAGAVA